jgi:hypothetical protein
MMMGKGEGLLVFGQRTNGLSDQGTLTVTDAWRLGEG